MNIDQQLRAALNEEAGMQNAPEPDVDRLISGGRARQRHRNMVRAGIVAAVAVVVAGGVYGIAHVTTGTDTGPPPAMTPSTSASPSTDPLVYTDTHGATDVEPGRYRMLAGVDADQVPIYADLTFYEVWGSGNYPVLRDQTRRYGGVAVYQPTALAAGTGCLGDKTNRKVGQTPKALAEQLTRLPHSTVVQQPTPVQAFGHPAVHLELRINPANCNIYRVADTIRGGHGISYGHTRQVLIDFWVENVSTGRPKVDDVGGVPVVVETWHQVGTSSQVLDQIARTRDSVTFITGG